MARLPLVAVAFFLSGAAALVYQVVWQRILELSSGIGIYSVAMIVGAFMAGLGLGSHAGSLWSTRLRPDRALWAFAAIELGVAVFGASSCALFYDLLYLRAGWLYSVPWRAGLLHFFSLLFPTLLMGMSLPFLARAMVHDAGRAARTIGILYGINVLGASFGAMATPWVLIRFAGMRGAVTAAAAANLLAGAAALLAALGPASAREGRLCLRAARSRDRSARPAGRWPCGWGCTRRAGSAPWPSRSCGSGSSTSRCARPPSRSGPCCLSTCSAAPSEAWPGPCSSHGSRGPSGRFSSSSACCSPGPGAPSS